MLLGVCCRRIISTITTTTGSHGAAGRWCPPSPNPPDPLAPSFYELQNRPMGPLLVILMNHTLVICKFESRGQQPEPYLPPLCVGNGSYSSFPRIPHTLVCRQGKEDECRGASSAAAWQEERASCAGTGYLDRLVLKVCLGTHDIYVYRACYVHTYMCQ